jgi:serine/threonine protein kinase
MDTERKILSFKDFKGFKRAKDIRNTYILYQPLGKGSFGEVRKASHIKANVDCAVKIIKKKAI